MAITFANKAFAQEEFGVNDLADAGVVLGTRSIRDTIGGIINIFLGFLGILATLLLLYAGYLWMTSKGNAEKVEKAKLLIASAVIGLVIILSAYAISRFILSKLYDVTDPGGSGPECTLDIHCPPGDCCNGNTCGTCPTIPTTCSAPGNPDEPIVCSLNRNSGPVGSNLTIRGWQFDTDGDDSPGVGRVEINGVVAEIVECDGSPMWEDRKVKVKIPDTLAEGFYEVILYNDVLPAGVESVEAPHFSFTVTAGTAGVTVDCLVPDEATAGPTGDLPRNIQILGKGFTNTEDSLAMDGWVAGAEAVLTNPAELIVSSWTDLQINMSVPTNALASNIIVDVGGDADWDYFDITCAADADCDSGCCDSDSCRPYSVCESSVVVPSADIPVIQSISPEDGQGETLVTIFGYDFGDDADLGNPNVNERGSVIFRDTAGDIPGTLPSSINGACVDTWTDDYIIMAVPMGAADELLSIEVIQASIYGGETSDPFLGFTKNAVSRPGICALDVPDGSHGDVINIEGVNFSITDTAYFDTVYSHITNVVPPNDADAQVPNIVGDIGVTMRTNDATPIISNPFPFSALSVTGGNPVIIELSPDNGPMDSYVTIMGSNFGDNEGRLFFDPDPAVLADEELGLFDFPAMCGDYWFDDHIIVRVPDTLTIGDSYYIRVERNGDLANSNNFDNFTVTNALVGPQICAINPDNGPINNNVRIFGENLGSVPGTVNFYNGVNASYSAWNANQVLDVGIPIGASTGPVVVTDADGNDSNGLPFNVGACTGDVQCGAGNVCCEGEFGDYCTAAASCGITLNSCSYSWDVSTEAAPFELIYNYSCATGLQSPSPWPDQHEWTNPETGFPEWPASLDAFVDSNISALFTRDVEDADFNDTNIILRQCDDEFCTAYIGGPLPGIISIINHNSDREGFVFNPDADLNPDTPDGDLLPDTWYEVLLGTFGAEIGADEWTPTAADEWTFKTRDSGLLCEVTTVAVTPQPTSANMYPGREKNFNASPLADNCNVCGGSYDWQWNLTQPVEIPPYVPPGDFASIIGPVANMDVNRGYTRLEGGPATTENTAAPNHVTLEATNNDFAITGQTEPVILAPVLRVEGHNPTCDDSCINVAVYVDFNTNLQTPLNIDDFAIYRCLDATCSAWDTGHSYTDNLSVPYPIPGDAYRVDIIIDHVGDPLLPNEDYKVIINENLDNSLVNTDGYSLVGDYDWTFGVGDVNCQITGANILPDNYTTHSFNDIRYKGYAVADGGICGEQAIQCEGCIWNWSSSDVTYATIDSGGLGAQTVYATPLVNTILPIDINLTIDGTALTYGTGSGTTPLTVDVSGTTPPGSTDYMTVDDYEPNCSESCNTPIVSIYFDENQVQANVDAVFADFHIRDSGGGEHLTGLTVSLANPRRLILDTGVLPFAETFTVTIPNTFNSADLHALQNPYTWNFGTNHDECYADGADVSPGSYRLTTAGGFWNYNVDATYHSPSCGDMPVYCEFCSYAWTLADNTIASITSAANIQTIEVTDDMTTDFDQTDVIATLTNDDGVAVPDDSGLFIIDTGITIVIPPTGDLNLLEYWPDCLADNACTNAEIGARFDEQIEETLLGGQYQIRRMSDGAIITAGHTLTGGLRTLILNDPGLTLGETYEITFRAGITSVALDTLGVDTVYQFTVGTNECRIDAVAVDPNFVSVGASQGTDYNVVTQITSMPGCGDMPIYCDTCSYIWNDDVLDLGTFNNATFEDPIFTTYATVLDGQATEIEVDVVDQGVTFTDYGDLEVSIGASVADESILINHYPPEFVAGDTYCYNTVPMLEFDTSGGRLHRDSFRTQVKLFEDCLPMGSWCEISGDLQFVEGGGITRVYFQPDELLNHDKTHRFLIDDRDLITSEDGTIVTTDTIIPPLWFGQPPGGGNSLSIQFNTGTEACTIHSVEIDYDEGAELFTCIDSAGCEGDAAGTAGNQHQYRALVYDIRGNLLATSPMTYAWASSDDAVVHPENLINANIYGTANSNGSTNLSVEASLVSDATNVLTTSASLQVNTCEVPWPSLGNLWNDGEGWNFSTYYCQNYDASSPAELPYIDVPHTTPSPDPNVLEEFITTIHYSNADSGEQHPYLGSLAYYNEIKEEDKDSLVDKITFLFRTEEAKGQPMPLCLANRPNSLNYTYDGVNTLEFSWNQPDCTTGCGDPTSFQIRRLQVGDPAGWQPLADVPARAHPNEHGLYVYTDNTVALDHTYRYRIVAENSACSPTFWPPISDHPLLIANTSADDAVVDIIAFRVMRNDDHLSVRDWYNEYAPNSDQVGSLVQVDGYEALQVGSTIYIAAANAETHMYTNIYIIAHNIGARPTTLNMYSQMLSNFKLNTNLTGGTENFCNGQVARSCSSDFDCPWYCDDFSGADELDCTAPATWLSDTCDSPMLKLRRDTKRLSDLVNINNAILAYGEANKACENNSLISCEIPADCPSGLPCVPYYPPLNAGSYLNGLTNSSWPSWQGAFSNTIAMSAPSDPIGLFNACGEGTTLPDYNADTCWNEEALDFICPTDSLVYMYNIEGIGQSYYLGANFEYDSINPPPGITFGGNLAGSAVTMDLNINNAGHCDFVSIDAPGANSSPYCGNGVVDPEHCSMDCAGCDDPNIAVAQANCNAAGGNWVPTEECDNEFWNFACSVPPPGSHPAYPVVGAQAWWNEQTVGCYSAGTIDTDTGLLIECTWYEPDPVLTANQCGGYCGDATLQPYYENCEPGLPVPSGYTCVDGNPADLSCGIGCQVMCDDSAGIYPAALCGDGIWSEGMEQCDASANPTGLAGWDCTLSGSIQCNNSCERTCTAGVPYPGLCGNGVVNGECSVYCSDCDPNEEEVINTAHCIAVGGVWNPVEACDYASYEGPVPVLTGPLPLPSYGCTLSCEFDNTYCGDGIEQYEDQEMCDYGLDVNGLPAYTTPQPLFSDEYNQYLCRDVGTYNATNGSSHEACTATLDGYCGDGDIQDGVAFSDYGEECDPGTPWDGIPQNPLPPAPDASGIANQYTCDVDCVGTTGGYCNDGEAQTIYGELCDGEDFPTRPLPVDSDPIDTYTCAADCISQVPGMAGGYCGDGVKSQQYYEGCDWGDPEDTSYYPWPRGSSLSQFATESWQYACSDCINQGGYCGDGQIDGECSVNCSSWQCSDFAIGNETDCTDAGETWFATSRYDCTEFECNDEGGAFTAYEDCDNGFDPAYVVNKDVDIVYIFDMSGSMSSQATDLCNSTYGVVQELDLPENADINYRISIFVLGDGSVSAELTATQTDNIRGFVSGQSESVFNALYTNCTDLVDVSEDPDELQFPEVRYLSFYDNATNEIDGGVLVDTSGGYGNYRSGDDINYQDCSSNGSLEDWGYAIKRIAESYAWLPDYHRVVIPVSDEHASCGSGMDTYDNYIEELPDADVLIDAVAACNLDEDNPVFINPVLINGGVTLEDIGEAIAADTGGLFTDSTTDWRVETMTVINSTICDGAGGSDVSMPNGGPDGHMDCTLPCIGPGGGCTINGQCCSNSCTVGSCD